MIKFCNSIGSEIYRRVKGPVHNQRTLPYGGVSLESGQDSSSERSALPVCPPVNSNECHSDFVAETSSLRQAIAYADIEKLNTWLTETAATLPENLNFLLTVSGRKNKKTALHYLLRGWKDLKNKTYKVDLKKQEEMMDLLIMHGARFDTLPVKIYTKGNGREGKVFCKETPWSEMLVRLYVTRPSPIISRMYLKSIPSIVRCLNESDFAKLGGTVRGIISQEDYTYDSQNPVYGIIGEGDKIDQSPFIGNLVALQQYFQETSLLHPITREQLNFSFNDLTLLGLANFLTESDTSLVLLDPNRMQALENAQINLINLKNKVQQETGCIGTPVTGSNNMSLNWGIAQCQEALEIELNRVEKEIFRMKLLMHLIEILGFQSIKRMSFLIGLSSDGVKYGVSQYSTETDYIDEVPFLYHGIKVITHESDTEERKFRLLNIKPNGTIDSGDYGCCLWLTADQLLEFI